MDENIEMLNYIYQNAKMGIEAIEALLKEDLDKGIKDLLNVEYKKYKEISKDAIKILEEKGREEKDIPVQDKIRTYFAVKVSTMKEDCSSKIAEMMIQGSNMGIIDITKNLNRYDDIETEVKALAERLLRLEQNSVDEFKPFL